MAGEKFTVTLSAKIKDFLANMKKATASMKKMGMRNRGIIKNMQGMSSASKRTGKALQTAGQKGKTGFDNIGKSATSAGKKMGKFVKGIGAATVALGSFAAAIFLIKKAFNSARLAAEMNVQAKAFANLAQSYGANSKKLLKDLKAASKETLSFMEIMTTASRAILLGIATDKLVDLMRIARAASKAMGTTVAGAFSDISLGIGRQSRLILDNLGIIVKVGAAQERYAQQIGTTADALTDFEKRQAFQNAVVIAGDQIIKRSATGYIDFQDKIARANAFIQDSFAKTRAVAGAFFFTLTQILTEIGAIKKFQGAVDLAFVGFIGDLMEHFAKKLVEIEESLKRIKKIGVGRTIRNAIFSSIGAGLSSLPLFGQGFSGLTSNTASGKVFESEINAGEEGSKELEKKQKSWGEQLIENYKVFLASATGQAAPTKSNLEVAELGIKALNEAFKDTNVAASDLQRQFALTMPAIAKGMVDIMPLTEEYTAALRDLIAKQKEVAKQAFAASLGLQTEKLFTKNANRDLEKVKRLLDDGTIINGNALLEATDKLLRNIRANVGRLNEEQRKLFDEIQTALAKIKTDDSIKKGLNQWVDDFNSTRDRLEKLGQSIAQGMAQAFDDFLFDAVTGKIKSLKDAFDGLFKSILRSTTKFVGSKAAQETLGLLGFRGQQTKSKRVPSLFGQSNIIDKAKGMFNKVKGLFGFGSKDEEKDAGSLSSIVPDVAKQTSGTIETKTIMTNKIVVAGQGGQGGQGGKVPTIYGDMVNQGGGMIKALLGKGTGLLKSVFSPFGAGGGGIGLSGAGGLGTLGSVGGALAGMGTMPLGLSSILGMADGGITSLADASGSAMIAKKPTLAAIAEKPGKKEAVVPLEKFAELVQQPNITINAMDAKSFSQFLSENKELVLGTINSVKGSAQLNRVNALQSGPF